MMRFRLRTLMIVVTVLPPVSVALLTIGAPFSHQESVCYECGMERHVHETWGWITEDQIKQNEVSRWAASMLPAGHVHSWTNTSARFRSRWFQVGGFACGGRPEGAYGAWQLAHYGDEAAAEQAYREYLDIRAGKSSKSMAVHDKELFDAIDAAHKAKQQKQIAESNEQKENR